MPSENRPHTDHFDPVCGNGLSGYSTTEPDIGSFSVNTPFHDDNSSARSVSQVTTRTATCTTATVTFSCPLMSSHPYTPPVPNVGTHMVDETSLHGRIWIPSYHSTPAVHRIPEQCSSRIGSRNWHGKEPDTQLWRLVSDDRPSTSQVCQIRPRG